MGRIRGRLDLAPSRAGADLRDSFQLFTRTTDGRVLPLELTTALPAWSVPLAGALGAFVLTAALTPLVIRLARRMGWLARPSEDRWHETPTALMGGVAIWAGGVETPGETSGADRSDPRPRRAAAG